MTNIETAEKLLKEGGYTCVLCKGSELYTAVERGVKPMLDFIDNGVDLRGFSVADKVVGKAAAMLFCHAGITEVHAEVISKPAVDFLSAKEIPFTYDEAVENIINRRGDGICPMEQATAEISDTEEAIRVIKKRLEELRKE